MGRNATGVDRLYLLIKDPHWTFLWWDLQPATVERLKRELGDRDERAGFVLRIHDVTDILFNGFNSHHSFDVPVRDWTDHWYLFIPNAGRNYCAEVGFKVDGCFLPAVRSNTAFLPRECPAAANSERWSTISIDRSGSRS